MLENGNAQLRLMKEQQTISKKERFLYVEAPKAFLKIKIGHRLLFIPLTAPEHK
jgi:hypothetical protein